MRFTYENNVFATDDTHLLGGRKVHNVRGVVKAGHRVGGRVEDDASLGVRRQRLLHVGRGRLGRVVEHALLVAARLAARVVHQRPARDGHGHGQTYRVHLSSPSTSVYTVLRNEASSMLR